MGMNGMRVGILWEVEMVKEECCHVGQPDKEEFIVVGRQKATTTEVIPEIPFHYSFMAL